VNARSRALFLLSTLSFILAGGIVLAAAGCATAYTTTASALIAAERVTQAAADQFPAFDAAKRKTIVDSAPSVVAGKVTLAEWDATVEKVTKAIEGAHASVRLGADGLKGVRDGLRDPKQLGAWIGPAIRVGVDLLSLLSAVGLKLKIGGL